jgi:NAD(P)-dependent dehydrogenase (short-subunit alcohol dehydrogenase family)
MGGAVARALAREGATTFLAGRTRAPLDQVAAGIREAGGTAEVAVLDAADPKAVEAHAGEVVEAVGGIDISFNAVGMEAVQEVPLVDLPLDDFMTPIVQAARTQFVTATEAARRMSVGGRGVILLLSSSAAREWRHRMGGFNIACAGIEAFTRSLAGEVGPQGVRVVCLRPNFTPETTPGLDENVLEPLVRDTLVGHLPRLSDVAEAAVFAVSDGAGATTGTVIDLTCGAIVARPATVPASPASWGANRAPPERGISPWARRHRPGSGPANRSG